MADLLNTTLAPDAVNTSLSALTEHGQIKCTIQGRIRIEQDMGSSEWVQLYEGRGPIIVLDYTGTALRITNTGTGEARIQVGESA